MKRLKNEICKIGPKISEFLGICLRSFGAGSSYVCAIFPVFVIGATVGGAVGGFVVLSGMTSSAHAGDQNVILAPTFQSGVGESEEAKEPSKAEDKIQYEPTDDEKPILRKKTLKEENTRGAHYNDGDELMISPDPGFDTKDQDIVEDVEKAARKPLPTPRPEPKVHEFRERSAVR